VRIADVHQLTKPETLARLLLGAALIATGSMKLFLPALEQGESPQSPNVVFGHWGEAALVAAAVYELVVGIALWTRFWRLAGHLALCFVLLAWAVLLATVASGGPIASCGCLGSARLPLAGHVALLLGLALLCWLTLVPPPSRLPEE